MSLDVTGFITWIRSFLDDVYAEKGSSGTDLELNLVPKSQNPNGVVCISGGNVNYDLDKVYPVGSIYMSVNPTNPSTLFGGTWVQLTNTFLYASSTAITQSNTTATDGEATHTLTTNEIPSHYHQIDVLARYPTNGGGNAGVGYSASGTHQNTSSTGGGQAHNNMPPYMQVNMWKRTA